MNRATKRPLKDHITRHHDFRDSLAEYLGDRLKPGKEKRLFLPLSSFTIEQDNRVVAVHLLSTQIYYFLFIIMYNFELLCTIINIMAIMNC